MYINKVERSSSGSFIMRVHYRINVVRTWCNRQLSSKLYALFNHNFIRKESVSPPSVENSESVIAEYHQQGIRMKICIDGWK